MNEFEQTPAQRAFKLQEAWHLGLAEAEKNDIKMIFKNLGIIRTDQGALSTYVCSANNNKTVLSSLGGGSGFTELAKVKALYESLEYSLGFQVCNQGINETKNMFSIANSPSTEFLTHQELLPQHLLQHQYQNQIVPWLKLTNYQEQTRSIYYPMGLIFAFTAQFTPQSDDFISEYSNDTGLAMGAKREEAIIHGLNEWIERDAYSLFLLKTMIHQNPEPMRMVCKDTLPTELSTLVVFLESHFNEELLIVDISSDLSIPAFLVSFTRQQMLIQPTGLGASLSKDAALHQALLELLQYKDRYNRNAQEFRADSFRHYANYPLLIKAMQCDLLRLIEQQHYIQLAWSNVSTFSLNLSLELQIKLMADKLCQIGAEVYYTTLYEGSSGLALTYTLVTGLETFFLIKDAKYSPLKKRGLGVLQ